ncbi:MAG TPA: hypothetical protein VE029_13655 [Rhizobacter sp.]|nr:hypothetical protein [Rhizobacter sp.]
MNAIQSCPVSSPFVLRDDLKLPVPRRQVQDPLSGSSGKLDRDNEFVAMLHGFRESGGLARGDEVADMLQRIAGHDVSHLARWIVTREVLSFQWHRELWVPLFQFNLSDMSLKDGPRRVSAELAPAFDAWNLSRWFVQPNAWLKDRSPLQVISSDASAVFQAARADRFVALG